jgi:lauroyl/myristoyl acyltransferase
MRQLTYIEERDKLVNNFTAGIKVKQDEYLNGQMNMVSAALGNYLPAIDIHQHDSIEMENCNDDILFLLKNKPTIICTFHTGSYRLLNLFLMKHKIPYSLVIGEEVVQREGIQFQSIYNSLPGNANENNFNIIDAEKANVGLQMLRELKRGRSLVLYMDGNTGAGAATTKNDNRCIVDFLHQQLYARKGIAFLAHAADVPIITVTCYRKSWENIRLKFFDPIFPDKSKERNLFAQETTQKIYDLVATIIKTYPEQWEGWLYIHKVANIINIDKTSNCKKVSTPTEKISLDSLRFGIFKINGTSFLLRKGSYSFYTINDDLYDVLEKCSNGPVKKNCMEDSLFNQLYEQGVINYV